MFGATLVFRRINLIAPEMLMLTILFLFSFYTLTIGDDLAGRTLIFSFALAALYIIFANSYINYFAYIRGSIKYLLFYFSLAAASFHISFGNYANYDWLKSSMLLITLSSILVISFSYFKIKSKNLLKNGLLVCFYITSVCLILMNTGILSIEKYSFWIFVFNHGAWIQKFQAFWYVFLTFGMLAFAISDRFFSFHIWLICIFSTVVILTGYSGSAKLALIVGWAVFFLNFNGFVTKRMLKIMKTTIVLVVFLYPLLLQTGGVLAELKIFNSFLKDRPEIYTVAFHLIKEHWFVGYGFGSLLDLRFNDLSYPTMTAFPGGHPHNLSTLFWLEFGLFGALLLSYFVHSLLRKIDTETSDTHIAWSIYPLFLSGFIIFSFSWDIWIPQCILTYAFWLSLILLNIRLAIYERGGFVGGN